MENRRKILYVSPHFSTGGLPQYLLKKIESLNDSAEIYCVEYKLYGDAYVGQRHKVISILGDRFIPLGDDKKRLIEIVDQIKPDVVHFEELAETFVDNEVLKSIYRMDREYSICETCHSSQFEPSIKTYKPDKFVMVSQWIDEKFKILGIPSEILEYPIENKKPDRKNSIEYLGLNPNKKHVINVGLFTPGKNQGELIKYAKLLENFPIEFHFVGNQAENFSDYWKPLMDSLPGNCKIWGERNDVDVFYQAADLFVFSSVVELNPLCIKESLSWKTPVLFRNLPTYTNSYNNSENAYYMSDDEDKNVYKILEILGFIKKIKD
jgi:glycosyltransferase involved in cell wall biosynthesis